MLKLKGRIVYRGGVSPANKINVSGRYVAIACQYPLEHQIESHLRMLVENRTPLLTVLSSQSEIDRKANEMPDYFTKTKDYPGGISTKSTLLRTVKVGEEGVEAKIYRLQIAGCDKEMDVDVVHVHNWPDKTAISADTTLALANLVNKETQKGVEFFKAKRSRAVGDKNKLLPVVHCRAGVGRSGQLIAAMVMQQAKK